MEIQRWSYSDFDGKFIKFEDGGWVKWSDVEELLASKIAAIADKLEEYAGEGKVERLFEAIKELRQLRKT